MIAEFDPRAIRQYSTVLAIGLRYGALTDLAANGANGVNGVNGDIAANAANTIYDIIAMMGRQERPLLMHSKRYKINPALRANCDYVFAFYTSNKTVQRYVYECFFSMMDWPTFSALFNRYGCLVIDQKMSCKHKDWQPFVFSYWPATRHMAAYRIQLYWRKCRADAQFSLCHRLQTEKIRIHT